MKIYKFRLHIRIPRDKINLNANFQVVIQNFLGNYWHFSYFRVLRGIKFATWRHGRGQILKIGKFRLHNRIPRVKISLNANFQVVIRIFRGITDISPNLWHFEGINLSRDVTGGVKIWKFINVDFIIALPVQKLI